MGLIYGDNKQRKMWGLDAIKWGFNLFNIDEVYATPTRLSLFRNNKNDILWCITIYFVGKTSFDSSLASH